jgi:inosine-uridine nucleoside N-ribohydrolase
MAKKIFLDTDIGSDIDDVICLTYLLNNSDCDLLGITTVTGEPEKRAKIARKLCSQTGKNIPVVSGRSEPLIIPQYQRFADQAKVLENWNDNTENQFPNAIDFMRRTIHENPHEVTLLAIGPLTNVALLFLVDPEIPSLLAGLVMMCGSFYGSSLKNITMEWNAICDPHAAQIVYNTPVQKHYSIGLDVTQKITMSPAAFREKFSRGQLFHVLAYAEIWLQKRDLVTFHDPLAAAAIFEPEIIKFEKGFVTVDMDNKRTMGFTDFMPAVDGPHSVAMDTNADAFFPHFFSKF